MNCPNCGAACAPGANFCPRCGCNFASGVPPQPPSGYPPPGYPQQYPPYAPYPVVPNTGKDKIAAGLLAIFLGSIGIHLFYLGRNGWGLVFLLGTLLTCGFGAIITSIISLVQGIMYLVATDYDFQQKYAIEKRFF